MFSVLVLTILLSQSLLGGGDNNGRGAKAVGLANAFVALADNSWALYYNPAGLHALQSMEASVSFIPQQFGLSELKTLAFTVAAPTTMGTVAAGVSQFGFELYRETELSIGIGSSLDWGVSCGVAVNLTRISIDQYGATSAITVDVGLLTKVSDILSLGSSFKNLLGSRLGTSNERMPQVFSMGASVTPISFVTALLEIEKDIRFPLMIKVGIEQVVVDVLALRAGVSNNPDKFSAGFGIRYAPFEFSYAGYSHLHLGWTHQIEISFHVGS